MVITVRSQSRNLAARTLFVAVLIACGLSMVGAASAGAATYSVYSCVGPGDEPLPNDSWLTSVTTPSQTLSFSFGSNCGDLSVLANPADNFNFGDGAAYVFDAPAGTTISGYAVNRAASITFSPTGAPSRLSAGLQETSGSGTTEFDCVLAVSNCEVKPSVVTQSGLALNKLSVGVRCGDDRLGCPAGSFTKLSSSLLDARVDIEDPTAPVITSVAGSLPGSSAPAGIQTLNVTATDVGGGVRMIDLAIDGNFTQTSVAGGSCGRPYTLSAPCPSGLERSMSVNTAALPDGMHTATVTATDAAGNLSSPHSFTFVVGPGGQSGGGGGGGGTPPSNGTPAVEQPTVKTEKSVFVSKNGRNVLVEGTLTTPDGTPIAGAILEVTALNLGVFNAAPKSIGTTTTTAAGRFSFSVKPDGARRVSVLFKPYPKSIGTAITSSIVREDLSLSVKAVKSRVMPGGLLTLKGALDGAGDAADGAPVEIDALIGKSWRAVGVVEANSRGSYKWRYRFTRVTQPTRFIFRAVVRRNKSWPWPTEISKRVKVLVAR